MIPQYMIQTKDGIFAVIQSMTYGELVIAGILAAMFVLQLVQFIWRILIRAGWL